MPPRGVQPIPVRIPMAIHSCPKCVTNRRMGVRMALGRDIGCPVGVRMALGSNIGCPMGIRMALGQKLAVTKQSGHIWYSKFAIPKPSGWLWDSPNHPDGFGTAQSHPDDIWTAQSHPDGFGTANLLSQGHPVLYQRCLDGHGTTVCHPKAIRTPLGWQTVVLLSSGWLWVATGLLEIC